MAKKLRDDRKMVRSDVKEIHEEVKRLYTQLFKKHFELIGSEDEIDLATIEMLNELEHACVHFIWGCKIEGDDTPTTWSEARGL